MLPPTSQLLPLLDATFTNWQRDRAPRMGAALAYYTVLSLAPVLVVILAVTGLAFGPKAAQGRLAWQITGLVGYDAATFIQAIILSAHRSSRGTSTAVLGLATLFFSSSGVVAEIRDALNTIWKVPDPTLSTTRSFLNLLRERLYAFAIVLATGLVLLASLVVSTWLAPAGEYLKFLRGPPGALISGVYWVISFITVTSLFAVIFRMLPSVKIAWSDVAGGALLTSLLLNAGRFLLNAYLSHAGFADTYGAAGSLVALLVWIYYSSQAFFFGAEFTRAYALALGSMRHISTDPPGPPSPKLPK